MKVGDYVSMALCFLVVVVIAIRGFGPSNFEQPAHVAKCVTWCEEAQPKRFCEFSRTVERRGVRYCECRCVRAFKGATTSWVDPSAAGDKP